MKALSRILQRLGYVAALLCAVFLVLQVVYPDGGAALMGFILFGLPALALFALAWVVKPAKE